MTPNDARPSGRKRARRGQAMVEFALAIPLFLAVLFGIVEGARLAWSYNSLSHAVQEGGRVAALPYTEDTATVQTAVTDKAAGLSVTGITVEINGGGTAYGDRTTGDTVVVSAQHTFVPIVSMVFGAGSFNLTARTELSVE